MTIKCGCCPADATVLNVAGNPRCLRHADIGERVTPKPSVPTTLPRPYQLLAELAAVVDALAIEADFPRTGADAKSTIQDLTIELWRAGQTERRVMAGDCDYDPPLWAKGMLLEQVTAAVGVPTVAPSDPAKDYGRGRTIR